jgi:hypothetical protein
MVALPCTFKLPRRDLGRSAQGRCALFFGADLCELFPTAYFVAVMLPETLLNVLETFFPRFDAPVIIATEISDAIKPYSIAVAPLSLAAKRLMKFLITFLSRYK